LHKDNQAFQTVQISTGADQKVEIVFLTTFPDLL